MSKIESGILRRCPRRVWGLTGSLGAGKSTVLDLLRARGAAVVSADAVVRDALENDAGVRRRVIRLLGSTVATPSGGLDRARVAAIVFKDPKARAALEKSVHPLVRRVFLRRRRAHRRGWLVFEVPLLFETGFDRLVDRTVTVWAPKPVVFSRLIKSGRLTRAEAERRWRAQMPPSEKRRRADCVLANGGTPARLRANVDRWIAREIR